MSAERCGEHFSSRFLADRIQLELRVANRAHTRGFPSILRDVRRPGDWSVDGAVSIESVSGFKFPVKQGKNTEFFRFLPQSDRPSHEKAKRHAEFLGKFLPQRNREF